MSSIWWNKYFLSSYQRFCTTFRFIVLISFSIRTIIALVYSFDSAFGGEELQKFSIVLLIYMFLEKLKSFDVNLRKLIMYFLIEILNIALRITSLKESKQDSNLLCLESTLVTLLFQSNAFESMNINFIISIKHVGLWYFVNEDFSLPTSVTSYMVCIVILLIWYLFERDKRQFLKTTHKAQNKEAKTVQELSTLIQIFPQGLIILDKDFRVQFKNDLIDFIIKDQDALMFLNECMVDDGTVLSKIKSSSGSICSSSLGISIIGDVKYEWCLKLIFWKKSLSYMITVRDVTKILNFERISSANKTKNEIIRSISHEFRTPLNGILLVIEDLKTGASEQQVQKISQIKTCTTLIEYYLNDILDYSELCFSKFALCISEFSLATSLQVCTSLITSQCEYKKLSFLFTYDESLPKTLTSDQYRLQKIIVNLLCNSLKFTQSGFIKLSASKTSSGVKIEVSDSGLSLSPSQFTKILKINSYESSRTSGIGLYICKKILKYFNSKLVAVSDSSGCSFSFVIGDGSEETNADSMKVDNEGLTESPGSVVGKIGRFAGVDEYPKLLLVDDNDFNRMFLTNSLKKRNILYLEAVNGLQAVEVVLDADRKGRPVTCCIMDCNMPVMDGWEASKKINKLALDGVIGKAPSIIAHTAYSSEQDMRDCLDAGMIDYIPKPTPAEDIIKLINRYL